MEFIDLHIHLQDYSENCATDIVKKAQKTGLKKLVCTGTKEQDWSFVADFALCYPELIVPAFGLHPWHVGQEQEGWQEKLHDFLLRFPQALVGETGLDKLKPDFELQKKCFEQQVSIAKAFNRPLIVHAVKAFADMSPFWKKMPPKFMFHSFNARVEQLREVLRYDGYVSFGASVLKNRDAEHILQYVPTEKFLLESDGPYQAPVKSDVSSPFFIPELLQKIADIRGDDVEELAYEIYQNSLRFIQPF